MMYYTTKKPETQGYKPSSFIHTSFLDCSKKSRCHNYKKCKTCHTIYKNKQINQLTKHLDEISIRKYQYKQYLVFTSGDTHRYENYKNADMENFINELIQTKRNKSSVLNDAQYIAIKEISHSEDMGYNPHYNFVYLSSKKFTQTKAFKKLASKYNIKVYVKEIYKSDRSYLTSIKKIINYSLKYDSNRTTIERETNLTKSSRDIKKSHLFIEEKYINLHKRLYKYISDINRHYNAKKREALKTYRNYNKSNSHTRVRMLKALNKKLNKIKSARLFYTRLATQGLTKQRFKRYTHIMHTLYTKTNLKT